MKLDIRTKTVILLTVSICTFVVNSIWMEFACMVIIGGIQLSFGKKMVSKYLILMYLAMLATQCFVLPVVPEMAQVILSIPVVQFRKMMPLAMVFLLIIRTTKVNELIATLTKMKAPRSATITLAVTLRYFPAIVEEWRYIKDAMKLRSVTAGERNPFMKIIRGAECYIVPLLISASKTADELAAAAITRGIENPAERTCRGYHKFGLEDYIVAGFCIIAAATTCVLKVVGIW